MDKRVLAESLLHKWKMVLKGRDRTKGHIAENFDDLIDGWKTAEIPREITADLIKEAIPEHYPPRSIARATYKKYKNTMNGKTEDEYIGNWESMIESEAYQVYYLYYPIEVKKKVQVINYGGMSKQEHMRQMAYAGNHPSIDLKTIRERRKILVDENKTLLSSIEVDLEML